ncbi:MAG: hypothetical protein WC901_03650 [Candidatus Margulisiibacteriota bacterium]
MPRVQSIADVKHPRLLIINEPGPNLRTVSARRVFVGEARRKLSGLSQALIKRPSAGVHSAALRNCLAVAVAPREVHQKPVGEFFAAQSFIQLDTQAEGFLTPEKVAEKSAPNIHIKGVAKRMLIDAAARIPVPWVRQQVDLSEATEQYPIGASAGSPLAQNAPPDLLPRIFNEIVCSWLESEKGLPFTLNRVARYLYFLAYQYAQGREKLGTHWEVTIERRNAPSDLFPASRTIHLAATFADFSGEVKTELANQCLGGDIVRGFRWPEVWGNRLAWGLGAVAGLGAGVGMLAFGSGVGLAFLAAGGGLVLGFSAIAFSSAILRGRQLAVVHLLPTSREEEKAARLEALGKIFKKMEEEEARQLARMFLSRS